MKIIETKVFKRNQINENRWNNFIDQSPQAIIYGYTWYLDVICDEWLAIINLNADGDWLAVMPIPVFKNYFLHRSYIPLLCQHLAIFYKSFTFKKEKELSLKKKILINTIDKIPSKIKIFKYTFSIHNNYLLPFYWRSYSLQTKYSYWLKIEKDKQINFQLFNYRTRTCIKKAEKNKLTCTKVISIERIIEAGKRNIKVSFEENKLFKLWKVLYPKNLIKAVEVTDDTGRFYSGIIYLKHRNKFIYLFGTVEEKFKDLGAMSLGIWHIIKNSEAGIDFHDFQGSMLETIEKFYRGFGASPVSYIQIYKNHLPLPLKLMHSLYKSTKI